MAASRLAWKIVTHRLVVEVQAPLDPLVKRYLGLPNTRRVREKENFSKIDVNSKIND